MAGMNATPSGERVRIGFFGLRNVGKSSLVNAFTGQDLAVVSDVPGTTTDAVRKAMELLPVGPVEVVDTPGVDDAGGLGAQRVERTRRVLRSCDVAVLVTEAGRGLLPAEEELVGLFRQRGIPFVIARNKGDLVGMGEDATNGPMAAGMPAEAAAVPAEAAAVPEAVAAGPDGVRPKAVTGDSSVAGAGATEAAAADAASGSSIVASARTGQGVRELKELVARVAAGAAPEKRLVADLLAPGDNVVLVVPIDSSAPKGRIILPQQMVLRDVLDAHAQAVACQPEELPATLALLRDRPRLVVTDSQAFARVSRDVPESVPLTSFSILMARYKGNLAQLAQGAQAISGLKDGDEVLISEGCTHHRQCEDIGTVKMPAWIRACSGARPRFSFTSGGEFPDDLSPYALVVHCGGCMLNGREMAHRLRAAAEAGVPIVNYGMAIAHINGILERSLAPLRMP